MDAKLASQIVAGMFALATTWLTVVYTKQSSANQEKTDNITKLEQRIKALESPPTSGGDTKGSPYVYWDNFETALPLNQCQDLIRDVFQLTGTEKTDEAPDVDASSFGEFGTAGSVTAAIACLRTAPKTTVMVITAGPDDTITKNHQRKLKDAVQTKLPQRK